MKKSKMFSLLILMLFLVLISGILCGCEGSIKIGNNNELLFYTVRWAEET